MAEQLKNTPNMTYANSLGWWWVKYNGEWVIAEKMSATRNGVTEYHFTICYFLAYEQDIPTVEEDKLDEIGDKIEKEHSNYLTLLGDYEFVDKENNLLRKALQEMKLSYENNGDGDTLFYLLQRTLKDMEENNG